MNIPVGTVEERQLLFSEAEPFAKIKGLLQSEFDGYVVATVEGASGLEEGLLLLKGRVVVGAVFDSVRLGKQLYGALGLRLVLNLLKSSNGVFDVNRLSKQQVDLIIAFNEKIRLSKPLDSGMLSKLEPSAYRQDLVSTELSVDLDASDSKHNLLKKFGIGSV